MRAIHGRRTAKQTQEDTKNSFEPGQFVQGLESRTLFSAANIIISPNIELERAAAASSSIVTGYTPAQIRNAYGFNSVDFSSGSSTVAGLGQGQTIAIVDAYNDPNISSDLNVFDSKFGLSAPPSLKIVNQTGGSSLPATDAGWAGEISLDVEWAHAIAPDANIVLVEAKSASLSDLLAGVNYARNAAGVSVVSMSWGGGEFYGETAYDSYFTTPAGHQGVTFVAAAGDSGSFFGPEWPAVSPNVIGVGGTSLTLANSGTYGSESAWGDSTGGTSQLEPMPSYQSGIPSADTQSMSFNWFSGFTISSNRSAPDVSYDADPNTGFAVYDSVPDQGYSGWQEVGGTSAGAPQWGALVAIADQGRALKGLGSRNGASQTLPALYGLASSSSYSSTFHDVTLGGSYFDSATTGYDQLTGLGSPRAVQVISALGGTVTSSSPSTTTVATSRTATSALRRADVIQEQIATPGVQATPAASAFVAHSPLQTWAGVEPSFALADTSPVTIIHSSQLTRFDTLIGSLSRLASSESPSSPLNLSESISQKIAQWPAVGLSGTGSVGHLARDVAGVLGSSIGAPLAGVFSGASVVDVVAPLVSELPATVLSLSPAITVRSLGSDRRWESVAAAALGATLAGCWYLNASRREKEEEARGLKARRVRGGWEMTPMEER